MRGGEISAIPIQIALPDPAVSLRVFELDALPKTSKEQLALVRWRFSKEMYFADRAIECSCQSLGSENGKHLLLALAVDQAWLHCLKNACRAVGVTSTTIDMSACYRFNRFSERLSADGCDGVLIALDAEAWSISICDAQGRLRFVRAQWRESTDPDDVHGYQDIITEIEQAVRAYAHAAACRTIKNIHITGSGKDITFVADSLDQRMEKKCIRLPGGIDFMCGSDASSSDLDALGSTLAATMLR